MEKFANEKYADYSKKEVFDRQKDALNKVNALLGKEYPNYIDGKEVYTDRKTRSINPGNVDEVIGIFQKSGKEDAEKAIQAAAKAFKTWKKVPVEERAQYLFKAAEIIRSRKPEIIAWMIKEEGKSYIESDADVSEGLDFLGFYGREALRYAEKQPVTEWPGEENEYFYEPLGVGIVIPPWNFPFAIMMGMTVAALVTGNTVVLKPSSDAPMMAWLFCDIMRGLGLPDGVLNYLVASGSEAGDYLVEHPLTRFISFTGSMEVGLRINELAAKKQPGQIWIKRVVAEMGGKDSIIVDSEADVADAAKGVALSAFGFQGQKCSACSRAIVDEKVYDKFVELLKKEVEPMKSGLPEDNFYCGPVINETAEKNILKYIEIGKKEGKLIIGGEKVPGLNGYYIKPTVFIDIDPMARLSQEEIFGPVLSVIKAKDYDDALNIANNTQYGLTGAVYSLNDEKIERARHEFHVGNLYLNRKCTGAMVSVQPFGGFNMSGTDSKAGGRDYLILFMQAKSVAKKIL